MRARLLPLPIIALAAAGLALATGQTLPISAHASFKSSNPTDLQVLPTSPSQLTITFGQMIAPDPGTFATVTNGNVDAVASAAVPDPNDPHTLDVPLQPNLPAGKYSVFWKSTSAEDGGVTFGRFSFFIGSATPADLAAAQPGASVAVPDAATQRALTPVSTGNGAGSQAAPTSPTTQIPIGEAVLTQPTPSYSVELDIAPAILMVTADQVQGATSGMVMIPMPGMSMAGMSGMVMTMSLTLAATDDGQPVNHHLGVHIHTGSTGALVDTIMPTITITDQTTAASETLNDVMPMYDASMGPSSYHYGNNVSLHDGDTYTVAVGIGSETATFSNIVPSGGMGLSSGSTMPMGGMTP